MNDPFKKSTLEWEKAFNEVVAERDSMKKEWEPLTRIAKAAHLFVRRIAPIERNMIGEVTTENLAALEAAVRWVFP